VSSSILAGPALVEIRTPLGHYPECCRRNTSVRSLNPSTSS